MSLAAALQAWLDGDYSRAESLLSEAILFSVQPESREVRAETGYWRARVRLQLGRADALAEYEQEMRADGGGLPRAVCWFVDLLLRAKLPERAEQVWKAVRGSPRITACDEAFLIEARLLLWRGELDKAEAVLVPATPRDSVLQTERLLFMAWAEAARGRHDEAARYLQQAERGRYPARALQVWARLVPPRPETAQPPEGVSPMPWFLHRATLALDQDHPAEALRWIARTGDPDLDRVRNLLPELRQMARAEALAQVGQFEEKQPAVSPGLLSGAVACLDRDPEVRALLDAAVRSDLATARQALQRVANRPELSPDGARHLALLYTRTALHAERHVPHHADTHWRLAWRCWLCWATQASSPDRRLVFDWLLAQHRQRILDSLGRNAIDAARHHWQCIVELSALPEGPAELSERIGRFREDLATEYLLRTRETMSYGDIPNGWRADYEKGLGCLTRLLSLDKDNVRLLTALIEICTEWFHDCYTNDEGTRLAEAVERFAPFALQLARLLEQSERPEWMARTALAEFTKFRGFVATDPERKASLYREALRLHPGNENVTCLLADLEEGGA